MDDSRSKSYKDARMQIENDETNYANNNSSHKNGMQDLRCYSVSHASSTHTTGDKGQMDIVVADVCAGGGGEQWKFKKGKSTSGASSKNWSFNDPELMRKKRVASYRVYTVEGKVKGSIKNSFRWIKERCNKMIYGHR